MIEPDPRYDDLLSLIHRQASRHRDKTFMTFGDGSTMSYGELDERIAVVRSQLWTEGIKNTPVALIMKNSLFYTVAWLGIVTAGCRAVPVNSRLRTDDARYVLEHSGAVAACADASTLETVRAAGPNRSARFLPSPIESSLRPPSRLSTPAASPTSSTRRERPVFPKAVC